MNYYSSHNRDRNRACRRGSPMAQSRPTMDAVRGCATDGKHPVSPAPPAHPSPAPVRAATEAPVRTQATGRGAVLVGWAEHGLTDPAIHRPAFLAILRTSHPPRRALACLSSPPGPNRPPAPAPPILRSRARQASGRSVAVVSGASSVQVGRENIPEPPPSVELRRCPDVGYGLVPPRPLRLHLPGFVTLRRWPSDDKGGSTMPRTARAPLADSFAESWRGQSSAGAVGGARVWTGRLATANCLLGAAGGAGGASLVFTDAVDRLELAAEITIAHQMSATSSFDTMFCTLVV